MDQQKQRHEISHDTRSTGLVTAKQEHRHAVEKDEHVVTAVPEAAFLQVRKRQEVISGNVNKPRRYSVLHLGAEHPPEGEGNDKPVGDRLAVHGNA